MGLSSYLRSAFLLLASSLASIACAPDGIDDAESSDNALDEARGLSDGHVCTDRAHLNAPLPCPSSKALPERDIAPGLVDNLALFRDPFYERFPLHHRGTLTLDDGVSKDYAFPTRYRDATTAIAMFFCSREKAKLLMPHPSMEPIDMGLGRSLVVITSYRYNRIHGMKGYNEVAITIPALAGRRFNPPIVPLLMSDFEGLGFYVPSMSVTTAENQVRGLKLWGLPKQLHEIDLDVRGREYVTTVKDASGKISFSLRVPMGGDNLHVDSRTFVYSKLDGTTYRTPSHAMGDFAVNKWMGRLALPLSILAQPNEPDEFILTLGDSSTADVLRQLEIAPRPFQTRFSVGTENVLDLPDAQLDEAGQAVDPVSYSALR
jgi:hypothetical protein